VGLWSVRRGDRMEVRRTETRCEGVRRMSDQWEYQQADIDLADWPDVLNQFGANGWEVVKVEDIQVTIRPHPYKPHDARPRKDSPQYRKPTLVTRKRVLLKRRKQ